MSTLAGVLLADVVYAGARAAVSPELAPSLSLYLAAAAASASSADAAACSSVAAPHAAGSGQRQLAGDSVATIVTSAAVLANLSIMLTITVGAPIVAQVPVGASVTAVVVTRIAAASGNMAAFPLTDAAWSAVNAVSSWGGTSFLAGGTSTVSGSLAGTYVEPTGPATSSVDLALALSLAVPLGVLAIVLLAAFFFGAAAKRLCCKRWAPSKALDDEISATAPYAADPTDDAAIQDMRAGFHNEERGGRM